MNYNTFVKRSFRRAIVKAAQTEADALSGVTPAQNETARAKPTPRVEARLIAKAHGLDGNNDAQINDELEARNGND